VRYAVMGATAQQVKNTGGTDMKETRTGIVFATLTERQAAQLKSQGCVINPVGQIKATVMPPAPVTAAPTYSPEQLVWAVGFEDLRGVTDPPLY